MTNVRRIAYNAINRVLDDGAYSAIVIDTLCKEYNLSQLDSSFLSALTYGVLERKILLDYIIEQYSSIRFSKIDKDTLSVLRLGVYQLCFMDKVPNNAAVNESVKLAKSLKLFRSSGFINAILRNIARNDCKYTLPNNEDMIKYFSVKYSCPADLVKSFISSYGEDIAERILKSFENRPQLTIRVNILKTSKQELQESLKKQGIEVEEVSYLLNALSIKNTGAIEKTEEYKKGLFYVQDASSQLCCEILDAKENDILCDVCSAPGGKSFYSAIKMNNKGTIHSFDIHNHKIRLIDDMAKRLGINIIDSSIRDASDKRAVLPNCNKLLCDVPCSGFGIIRRKPEIRYKKDINIDLLPQLQYSILCSNCEKIPTGCTVVYSTCTLNNKENKDIVEKFLSEHKNFEPVSITLPENITHLVNEPAYMLTIIPGVYNSDGFFISKFKKVSE
ncbi:MAG: 16S rRNA (cytosine(967)-C(5))-methyltransferase RsmB [Oscillospiraceae bacterium]|nr:16S rRNA (cytosine(967)-C(5))-methyltransferase RsmB [Candidatus Ruminococcus equi]